MGYSHFNGKFANATGTVTLDEAHPENSKLSVTVNTTDIVTGVPKLDEHLKSDSFFNVAKFPTATFVSTKVEPTGKDTANVTGNLTLLGVTKPLTLAVKLNKSGQHPMMHKPWVGFDAATTIKRSDWGLSYGIPMVSDEVKIEVEAEAGAQ
jgi:polyisoprenoid-binding protein YceI